MSDRLTELNSFKKGYSSFKRVPIAQWVKHWPTDPAVPGLSSAQSRGSAPLKTKPSQPWTGFYCIHPFIIMRPSSWYDWNTVEKDVKSQVIHLHSVLNMGQIQMLMISEPKSLTITYLQTAHCVRLIGNGALLTLYGIWQDVQFCWGLHSSVLLEQKLHKINVVHVM